MFMPRHRSIYYVLLLALLVVLLSSIGNVSFAQSRVIYYIDDNGSDSNPGTLAQPFRTIGRALSATPTGHEYVFLDGVYTFPASWDITRGGTSINDYVVYRSLNRWGATIRMANAGYTVVRLQANYIEFNGFHVDGNNFLAVGHCISSEALDQGFISDVNLRTGYHHQRILNNWVHHCGSSGIQMNYGDFYFVEGNLVHNTSYLSEWNTSGISVYYPTPLANSLGQFPGFEQYHIVIRNNVSHSNLVGPSVPNHWDGNGIILDRFRRNYSGGGAGSGYQYESLIENNLVYNNGGQGIHLYQTDNVTIRNNTLYWNHTDPLFGGWRGEMSNSHSANNKWYNNIAVANPNRPGCSACAAATAILDQPSDTQNSGTIWQNNILFNGTNGQLSFNGYTASRNRITDPANNNRIGVNPMLVSPGLGNVIPGVIGLPNFRPQASSPALGNASTIRPMPYNDLDGNGRPGSNRDIGAYELGGTTPTATAQPPLMLTVTNTPAVPTPTILPGAGSVLREVWLNVQGTNIANLRALSGFPASPNVCTLLSTIQTSPNGGDNYGLRLRGFIIPSTSAAYTFWTAGDDDHEFWLSTNASPANLVRRAWVENGWTNPTEWTKYATQRSTAVNLVAGQSYYFEVLQKEGGGGDSVQVAWETSNMARQIIGSANLSSAGLNCGSSVVPTATPTTIPTATLTATNTPPPTTTNTPVATHTQVPTATQTPRPTNTLAPTATVPPTSTRVSTATPTPLPTSTLASTATYTPLPTNTLPPTTTHTPFPTSTLAPTATTTLPPTATFLPTNTPVPTTTGSQVTRRIEAESYIQSSPWIGVGQSFDPLGGVSDLRDFDSGDWVAYQIDLGTGVASVRIRAVSPNVGAMTFRIGSSTATPFCVLNWTGSGGWGTYATREQVCNAAVTGIQTVFVRNENMNGINTNWFQFVVNTSGTLPSATPFVPTATLPASPTNMPTVVAATSTPTLPPTTTPLLPPSATPIAVATATATSTLPPTATFLPTSTPLPTATPSGSVVTRRIEAEAYVQSSAKIATGQTYDPLGGTSELRDFDNGDWVAYTVDFGSGLLGIRVRADSPNIGTLSFRVGAPTAPAICVFNWTGNGGWGTYITLAQGCTAAITGVHTIYVTNEGMMGINTNWIEFDVTP
ncbi:MAG: carbohydrate-binding protein [Chloroflexota bacterium]|nr:carbohydrate-binding protein [Chloroflexota bacterium]